MSPRLSNIPARADAVSASRPAVAGQRAGGNAAGMAAIGLWSSLALLATWTGAIPPLQLLAICFFSAGVLGLALPLWRRPAGLSWRQSLRQPWSAYVLTTSALFSYHALYFLALKTAPPVEASLINYLWPLLIVLVVACLPGARPPPKVYVAVAMGFFGAVAVVTRMRGPELQADHALGYLAAFGAALVWAAYSVLNRRHAGIASTALALPCLTVAVLATISHSLLETTVAPGAVEWLAIMALGLGPVGGAFWLWDHGTKHGQLAVLGTLAYAAPVLSTLWLLLAGQAQPHWSQALACGLIVGAGLMLRRVLRPAGEPSLAPPLPGGPAPRSGPP